jgi:hypothetical protein
MMLLLPLRVCFACFPLLQTRGWTTLSICAYSVLQLNPSWHHIELAYWRFVYTYWLSFASKVTLLLLALYAR